jgi:hypothetical protein
MSVEQAIILAQLRILRQLDRQRNSRCAAAPPAEARWEGYVPAGFYMEGYSVGVGV